MTNTNLSHQPNTAQQLLNQYPNATFEHTGGNVYTVFIGYIAIGPFYADGTASDELAALDTTNDEFISFEGLN